jgi:hypothetical protein
MNTEQINKLATEIVPYLKKAIANNPSGTQYENMQAAMDMWFADSCKMAELPQQEWFCNWAFNNFG